MSVIKPDESRQGTTGHPLMNATSFFLSQLDAIEVRLEGYAEAFSDLGYSSTHRDEKTQAEGDIAALQETVTSAAGRIEECLRMTMMGLLQKQLAIQLAFLSDYNRQYKAKFSGIDALLNAADESDAAMASIRATEKVRDGLSARIQTMPS
ncbi:MULTISPECIES: hypothetical protein [unclassified Variovorax]|uniref:hypothetical protein n=1 Tax=unclassified Variovorax TaxID=663243 RepID=UPI00076D5363|nr:MULTISPECIES: hypothetical protein [unclassified Variovorax]KWT98593.1 hypothetical protein APY03_0340 [Variovorax sp. WDL1]PNG46738.1 hypothetical protein CHC06_07081 [Variovorax sp. B2]PNG48611.1 hypothetical protein CHC07_07787 [Variovorax sp. B4]VTV14532.1 hypothetical protein WDL1CHR_05054 [Variovorax sp. WDL1]